MSVPISIDTNEILAVVAGYGFSLVAGNFLIAFVMDHLWQTTGASSTVRSEPGLAARLPKLVGLVERCLYVASFQIGKPEFVAVWLALKVAGQWKRWEEGGKGEGVEISGRAFYNLFLIGSGLSIAYGVVGAKIIEYIQKGNWANVLIVPGALVLATTVLRLMARPMKERASTPAQPREDVALSRREDSGEIRGGAQQ